MNFADTSHTCSSFHVEKESYRYSMVSDRSSRRRSRRPPPSLTSSKSSSLVPDAKWRWIWCGSIVMTVVGMFVWDHGHMAGTTNPNVDNYHHVTGWSSWSWPWSKCPSSSLWEAQTATSSSSSSSSSFTSTSTSSSSSSSSSTQTTTIPVSVSTQSKSILDVLMGEVYDHRTVQEERLRQLYGNYYNVLFDDPSQIITEVSKDKNDKDKDDNDDNDKDGMESPLARLQRRLMLAILRARVNGGMSSSCGASAPTFVWATAGDGAAAGHGNLFEQSYTATMEEMVGPTLASLGVTLEARNYAMGGYAEGPELALCMEAIYGRDVDVLVTDFFLLRNQWNVNINTDKDNDPTSLLGGGGIQGPLARKRQLWNRRARWHPSRPIQLQVDGILLSLKNQAHPNDDNDDDFDDDDDDFDDDDNDDDYTDRNNDNNDESTHDKDILFLQDLSERIQHLPVTRRNSTIDEEPLPQALHHFLCEDTDTHNNNNNNNNNKNKLLIEGSFSCDANHTKSYQQCDGTTSTSSATSSASASNSNECRRQKYNTKQYCSNARYQNAYHPGWKYHLLKGSLLGYFMLHAVAQALEEIMVLLKQDDIHQDEHLLLQQLLQQERTETDKHWQAMASQPLPSTWFLPDQEYDDHDDHDDDDNDSLTDDFVWEYPHNDNVHNHNNAPVHALTKLLMDGPTLCHTALLPSQSRYKGVVTDTVGRVFTDRDEYKYDRGVNKLYHNPTDTNHQLTLVYDPNDRQKCKTLEIDHKDFFYVQSDDEWLTATLPTATERRFFFSNKYTTQGLILVCLKQCPFGTCPREAVGFNELYHRGVLSITVDGQPVVDTRPVDECHFLVGEQGIRWTNHEKKNTSYELKFRIDPKTGRWIKISSIIFF